MRKHQEDGGGVRLRARIERTLEEFNDMAKELRDRGYSKAAEFLEKYERFMITFAELVLEGVEIPYTTNRIERLMLEISNWCKHRWMH